MVNFTWIYSDTDERLLGRDGADVYLLVPEPFQDKYGKAIKGYAYNGFGNFNDSCVYDIYSLAAEWNKEYISVDNIRKPQKEQPRALVDAEYLYQRALANYEKECKRLEDFISGKTKDYMLKRYGSLYRHDIGLCLISHNEDNFKLKYPIKMTTKIMPYDEAKPSKTIPEYGWGGPVGNDAIEITKKMSLF